MRTCHGTRGRIELDTGTFRTIPWDNPLVSAVVRSMTVQSARPRLGRSLWADLGTERQRSGQAERNDRLLRCTSCSATPISVSGPEPMVQPGSAEMPPPADRSARLQLFGEIARGGMGAVLKGRDTDLGRDLAVKVLLEPPRDQPEMVRRFVEEAQIGGQLQHPGVVPVYELGAFADRRPYFAMKLVKGRTRWPSLLGERSRPGDATARASSRSSSRSARRGLRPRPGRDPPRPEAVEHDGRRFGEVQVMDWGLAKVLPQGGVADDEQAGKSTTHETVIATARSGRRLPTCRRPAR